MVANNLTDKVTSGLFWRLMERIGAQAITFVVSILLARLLDPSVYGTIALVTVFTSILQVFVDSGFGNALIQKKNADDVDFSSVFYFNIVACSLIYVLVFFFAPLIANLYEKPELISIIRVLSLTIVISGIKNVQQAYISRNMLFKRFFFSTLGGTIGAGIIGVLFAYLGFGVWALVFQHLFNLVVDTTVLWVTVKWRPKRVFSFSRLKELFSFGWKLLLSALLDTGYRELKALIIGKKYSTEDLAFFNRGQTLPSLIVTNINSSIDSVLFPTLSSVQDNRERVKAMTRKAIRTSTFLMMPMMIGLAVCAESVVRLLLTDKWLPAVFYLRVFCISFAFYPIHTANLNAIKAMGRSDFFLKLEVIKKTIGCLAIFTTMFVSVKAMAISELVVAFISMFINAWPNRKLLNYYYIDQLKDIFPQIFLSGFMGLIIFSISFLTVPYWAILMLQIPVGIVFYWGISKILNLESYVFIRSTVRDFLQKRGVGNKKNI